MSKKERYEYIFSESELPLICNIHLLKADDVHYFGFEDIGKGKNIGENVCHLAKKMVEKYQLNPEDAFFFKWYIRYKSRGVEWIEFEWNDKIPLNPKIKKFCEYEENPFF